MPDLPFLQQLYNYKVSQKKQSEILPQKWIHLTEEEKNELSFTYIEKAKKALHEENSKALEYFEIAMLLAPENPRVWFKAGETFYEYGIEKNQDKTLIFAAKHFQKALELDDTFFSSSWKWAQLLAHQGSLHNDSHYYCEAKEKYQKAISLSTDQPEEIIAELYWDYALTLSAIGAYSGEAIDVRLAIQAYRNSLSHQKKTTHHFHNDFGSAFTQMGMLVNDHRLFLQAVEQFHKAVELEANEESYPLLATAYTQLYINTANEKYLIKADEAFSLATKNDSTNIDQWLEWAQLLGEAGKQKPDAKYLRLSVEKSIRAFRLNRKVPQVIGQWVEALSLLGAHTGRLDLIHEAEIKIKEACIKYPGETNIWYAYGICYNAFALYYNDLDYHEFALEKFKVALSHDKSNPEIFHAIGYSYTRIGKNTEDFDVLEKACAYYQKAIDLKPACPFLIFDYAYTLFLLGELTRTKEHLEKALGQFDTLFQLQKETLLQHPNWLFYQARTIGLLGELTENIDYLTRATDQLQNILLITPDYPKIYFHIAISLARLGDLTETEGALEKACSFFCLAIKQAEEEDVIWLEWGLCLLSQADHSANSSRLYMEAEQKITRAGQLGNQHAYYYLACLYSLTNRLEKSMELLVKAKQLDMLPPTEEILDDAWLENIRSTDAFSLFLSTLETKNSRDQE